MTLDELNRLPTRTAPLSPHDPDFSVALDRALPGWRQSRSRRPFYAGDEGLRSSRRPQIAPIVLTTNSEAAKNIGPESPFEAQRIHEAMRVWSRVYGRQLTGQEALDILLSVRQFARVLAERARQQ